MSAAILIAGTGQLGSRYLQGMANCRNTLDIYVQDISEQSLQIAKQRWEQVVKTVYQDNDSGMTVPSIQHKVSFLPSFEKLIYFIYTFTYQSQITNIDVFHFIIFYHW